MKKQVSLPFMFAGILFTTCLLVANVLAVKIISIGPWAAPAGILVFPLAYIINDVIAEVWGYRKARLIIWSGFLLNLLAVLLYFLAIHLPAAPFWENQEAFSLVLGSTPRIVVASLIAYLVGSFLNAYVLSRMKIASKGKNFGWRAIASTLVGESADSFLFILIAFAGIFSWHNLLWMITTQALLKTVYEIVILPVTVFIVKRIKSAVDEDVYDENTSYNPFRFKEL
jgi:queuosine precursor transporter